MIQRYLWGAESVLGSRAEPRRDRRGHIAYARAELHDVGDDITRLLSLRTVFPRKEEHRERIRRVPSFAVRSPSR